MWKWSFGQHLYYIGLGITGVHMPKNLIWVGALSFLFGALIMKSNDGISCDGRDKEGTTLQLTRGGSPVTTVRAQFCYSSDCALIAKQMNLAEAASWSCR
jgi:hypothetical protein